MSLSQTLICKRSLALLSLLSVLGLESAFAEPSVNSLPEPPEETLTTPLTTPLVPLTAVEEWPEGSVIDDALWEENNTSAQLRLLTAIAHSLSFLDTPAAEVAYENYPIPGITRDRVRRSLQRFRTLLITSSSPESFHEAIQREFLLYQSIGNDSEGTVHFTGYFEPSYQASLIPTTEYRYPLYQRPQNLDDWTKPHPTRVELEGTDGLQSHQGPLAGLELVWMRDRLEAFLVQVQGSARLQLTDGSFLSVGYAGRTEYDYVSIGRELINDDKVPEAGMTLERLLAYFQAHPEDLDVYLPRNNRFVFFRETSGGPPTGTFSVPVTAGRSIATDKTLMPAGAIALINLDWPQPTESGQWQPSPSSRYVLNQDTGGAIQGPGRVDIFIGSGHAAGEQAGQINTDGVLFFLLLRE
ncbi:MltA domain-containing protein [Oscillatoria sp. CS-180]|uniref:murein transglycosylase A n=1 Tax=Oscillatoria sp. CS-180 TaxID=3021720 RepID=UPI00232AD741|nr:MltA domain-containing protein [Oscillatoria sp. CS-180]MDB9528444.1 MltA domain-containing protein [Oscillatoria sp. CS-180]